VTLAGLAIAFRTLRAGRPAAAQAPVPSGTQAGAPTAAEATVQTEPQEQALAGAARG
jgi:hypothetical protein